MFWGVSCLSCSAGVHFETAIGLCATETDIFVSDYGTCLGQPCAFIFEYMSVGRGAPNGFSGYSVPSRASYYTTFLEDCDRG